MVSVKEGMSKKIEQSCHISLTMVVLFMSAVPFFS